MKWVEVYTQAPCQRTNWRIPKHQTDVKFFVLEKRLEDQRKVQNASECIYVLARSRNPDFLRLGPSILRQQFPWLIFVHTSAVGMVADVTNKGVNDAGAFFCLSGPGLGGRWTNQEWLRGSSEMALGEFVCFKTSMGLSSITAGYLCAWPMADPSTKHMPFLLALQSHVRTTVICSQTGRTYRKGS